MLVKVERTGEWAPIQKSRVWPGGRKSDVYLPSIWVSWVEEIRHSSPTTESALGESVCAACVVPVVVGDADKIDVRRRLFMQCLEESMQKMGLDRLGSRVQSVRVVPNAKVK